MIGHYLEQLGQFLRLTIHDLPNFMSKDIRNILVFTLIAVAAWIGFSILHTTTRDKTEIPGVAAEQLRPLEPRLDLEMLKMIREAR